MPHPTRQLGKLPAVRDRRIPFMASRVDALRLPPPPPSANWTPDAYALNMLRNDEVGCCTAAAVGHCIQQMTGYRGSRLIMSDDEAINLYTAVTGYNPRDPNTDQGAYMLGPEGVIPYWTKNGVTIGGKLDRVEAFLQIDPRNIRLVRQAIHLFGGVLVGFTVPESILYEDFMWDRWDGPIAGGHEVWVNGYNTLSNGWAYYEVSSWGAQFRMSERFWLRQVDECIAVLDNIAMNQMGVDARGVDWVTLLSDMSILRHGG